MTPPLLVSGKMVLLSEKPSQEHAALALREIEPRGSTSHSPTVVPDSRPGHEIRGLVVRCIAACFGVVGHQISAPAGQFAGQPLPSRVSW